jgi:serine O-acetyltransferase
MITKKLDLHNCLSQDSRNYERRTSGWLRRLRNDFGVTPISDQKYIWKYIKTLRYVELYTNRHKKWEIPLLVYYRHKLNKLSYKTGFQIPPNVIGPGMTIWHWGTIIINEQTKIGKNVELNPMVIIGHKEPGGGCPVIGDNCFIGGGARIIGNIHIGNNVTIAPNAVVVKDVPDGTVVGGIPAKSLR